MISVQDVSFRYERSDHDALCDIRLEFLEGSFTAIMGANGSGKSTLARCLNGLLQPTSGEVLVDGLSTSDAASLNKIRRKVGFVFQDPNLQMTSPTIERELAFGLQNIGVPFEEIHRKIDGELQRLGLAEKRLAPPSSLAGGERQRLAFASILMLAPKYLVLDEPTSFLSPPSRKQLIAQALEQRKSKGTAIIFVTQYISEALSAERLVVLNNSKIMFDGNPDVALQDTGQLISAGISVPGSLRLPV